VATQTDAVGHEIPPRLPTLGTDASTHVVEPGPDPLVSWTGPSGRIAPATDGGWVGAAVVATMAADSETSRTATSPAQHSGTVGLSVRPSLHLRRAVAEVRAARGERGPFIVQSFITATLQGLVPTVTEPVIEEDDVDHSPIVPLPSLTT
jgi:hypothetical protein